MKEDNSLTPEEVASILKITKHTVYEMVKRGELPAYRIGRKIRIEQTDLETYKQQGKHLEQLPETSSKVNKTAAEYRSHRRPEAAPAAQGLVICGQDILLDILAHHLESHPNGCRAYRHNAGSFSGLSYIYQNRAQMAAIHLWDGDSDIYNIPYVRRLVPGIPTIIIHLAFRMQGFYVPKGNPKNINSWEDLTRSDLVFVNRETGCGTRILLDEHLHRLKVDRHMIKGYENEELTHLAVASKVARGVADFALGNEKAALQVRGIDFIPLQKERYELVVRKEDMALPHFQAVLDILASRAFQAELEGLGDYDLNETGRIVAEV
ncbi:MAG: helix-turn-helix transcriptional regulator [Syntrophomonadaceae bacterium]|nr:helix-turn-helix transcriptional regulator [Syntrophomonadaceae bacterium]MDD3023648.1 helix-turn-helix transcriptional regulator [Syntrophomonadaceae bacterium]